MSDPGWRADRIGEVPAFEPGFQTEWNVVRTARDDSADGAAALEQLARTYWYPLYLYVRHRGCSPHDAEDLTQAFFGHLLERPWLNNVHPSKGRFRSFLLASLNHFLANEWRRGQTQKRGGGQSTFSIDAPVGQDGIPLDPGHTDSPDRLFDRHWAQTLLGHAQGRLEAECAEEGKAGLFEELKGLLEGDDTAPPYRLVAGHLNLTESAVRKAAQRLRERYRELILAEITQTVDNPRDAQEELRHLMMALKG